MRGVEVSGGDGAGREDVPCEIVRLTLEEQIRSWRLGRTRKEVYE